jgi:hypothetical protein
MKVYVSQFFGIGRWLLLAICVSLISISLVGKSFKATAQEIDTFSSQSNQTAETRQIDFTLNSQSNQTFPALMQQAEVLATRLIEEAFAESPSITEVSVRILGERNGQQAPLVSSKVSRSDWQKQHSIQRWTKYFGSSAMLLGFSKPPTQQSTSLPNMGTSTQQSTSLSTAGISTQQPTSPPTADMSTRRSTSPLSAGIYTPTGERIESDDPGYR